MRPKPLRHNSKSLAVVHDDVPINGAGAETFRLVFEVRRDRAKKRAAGVAAMSGRIEVFFEKLDCAWVCRNVSNLSAFPVNAEVPHAPAARELVQA